MKSFIEKKNEKEKQSKKFVIAFCAFTFFFSFLFFLINDFVFERPKNSLSYICYSYLEENKIESFSFFFLLLKNLLYVILVEQANGSAISFDSLFITKLSMQIVYK